MLEFVRERLWHNGGRWTLALGVLLLVLAVSQAVVFYDWIFGDGWTPLRIGRDVRVGSEVHVGGRALINVTVCNDSDEVITTAARSQWISDESFEVTFRGRNFDIDKAPGCTASEFTALVSPDVTAGRWRFQLIYVAERNGDRQRISTTSEPFEVLP